jgi:hypothetical protein
MVWKKIFALPKLAEACRSLPKLAEACRSLRMLAEASKREGDF